MTTDKTSATAFLDPAYISGEDRTQPPQGYDVWAVTNTTIPNAFGFRAPGQHRVGVVAEGREAAIAAAWEHYDKTAYSNLDDIPEGNVEPDLADPTTIEVHMDDPTEPLPEITDELESDLAGVFDEPRIGGTIEPDPAVSSPPGYLVGFPLGHVAAAFQDDSGVKHHGFQTTVAAAHAAWGHYEGIQRGTDGLTADMHPDDLRDKVAKEWGVVRATIDHARASAEVVPVTTEVVLESPYAGNVAENVEYARRALADCLARGEAPFASHLLYTQVGVLDDSNPDERKRGIAAGYRIADLIGTVVFYMDLGMSPGMARALERFTVAGKAIEFRYLDARN